jgi:hypothetical protein
MTEPLANRTSNCLISVPSKKLDSQARARIPQDLMCSCTFSISSRDCRSPLERNIQVVFLFRHSSRARMEAAKE